VVIGRAVNEATGFDEESLNRSIKMTFPNMGPNIDFKQWKGNFLTFLSLNVAYLIPQLAIRKANVWLDEAAQTYSYAMLPSKTSALNKHFSAYVLFAMTAPLQLWTSCVSG
jgi:hypothetical protein